MLRFKSGDLLASNAQTLVNTVNCVGVMGKGIALRFKRAYPKMFFDYVERCAAHQVMLGHPYIFRTDSKQIVNFPTKNHWRGSSDLESIKAGLECLRSHALEWKIESLAIPALGCGQGGLDWGDVRPLIVESLSALEIDIEIFEPALAHFDQQGNRQTGGQTDAPLVEGKPIQSVPQQQSLF